jgi:pimeloyl-ACP methyl ester carboxylesterase
MASDVLAVMDTLHLQKAALVGWSDGACTSLILAAKAPSRAVGVFYFACNMDPSGVKPFEATPTLNRCFARHAKDYAELSATPAARNHDGDVQTHRTCFIIRVQRRNACSMGIRSSEPFL